MRIEDGAIESPKTVLVVDDIASIRDLAEVVMRDVGYRVLKAGGGAQAIEHLQAERPDLVVLDLLMPDIDGWGVLEFISKMPEPPRVVVLSGHTEIVPPGHLCHFVGGYVPKPFDLGQLLGTCKAVLGRDPIAPGTGQRRGARRTFFVRATVLSPEGTPLLTARVQNISREGIGIELTMPLAEGEPLRLSIPVPGTPEPLVLEGRVVWRRDSGAGILLTNLTDYAERLLEELVNPE